MRLPWFLDPDAYDAHTGLVHMCWSCASRLGLHETLLPGPGPSRRCPHCKAKMIGLGFKNCIQWPHNVLPIAIGLAFRKAFNLAAQPERPEHE